MPDSDEGVAKHLAEIRQTLADCLEFGWEVDMFTTADVEFLVALIDEGDSGG